MDQHKQKALLWIEQARSWWDESGQVNDDYMVDIIAFFTYLYGSVLPKWISKGGNKDVFYSASLEYARRDWIMSGRNQEELDPWLQALAARIRVYRANRERNTNKIAVIGCLSIIMPFLSYLIAVVILDETTAIVAVAIAVPIVIFVGIGVHACWSRFKYRKEDRIMTLKL